MSAPMSSRSYVRWFENIRLSDIPEVGGKNALLGELYSVLAAKGVRIPDGFALTADAYRDALAEAGVEGELRRLLSSFDHHDVALLADVTERDAPRPKSGSCSS
jgi:pyruvate, water dikinase